MLAAASDTTIKETLLKGWAAGPCGQVFKVHLDGYNILPYLEGKEATTPHHNFFYPDGDGQHGHKPSALFKAAERAGPVED